MVACSGLSSGMQRTGEKDVRGRQAVSVTLLDVLIEQRPGLDRDAIDTDRADNTILTVLDPVAITGHGHFSVGRAHAQGEEDRWRRKERSNRREVQLGSDGDSIMASVPSVLDWAYWHLARDTTRRVLLAR